MATFSYFRSVVRFMYMAGSGTVAIECTVPVPLLYVLYFAEYECVILECAYIKCCKLIGQ